MCHTLRLLQDPTFFHFLLRIDEELATATRHARCGLCAGPLHRADYPRKPRGCPASMVAAYSSRFSFTCGRCEKRATSVSVRFLGRRVYLAVVLMLVSPRGGARSRALNEQLAISRRTLDRWRKWWTEDFVRTPLWQSRRERFAVPVDTAQLPQSLLACFDTGTAADRMLQLLRLVAPVSTRAVIR